MNVENDLSVGEKTCKNFDMYITNLVYKKRSFYIPFELKRVILRDVGVFDRFEAEFKDFNVVYGADGTGKTTFVRSIAYALDLYRYREEELLKKDSFHGDIEVEVVKRIWFYTSLARSRKGLGYKVYTEYIPLDESDFSSFGYLEDINDDLDDMLYYMDSILLDDAGAEFTKQRYTHFLEYLQELNGELQVILTVKSLEDRPRDMFLRMFPNCNFIDLNSLESQRRLF